MSVEVLTQGGGANLQSRSVNLTSTSATTFSPQSGYDGMSSITVKPNLQSKSVTLSSSSATVSPDSGYSGLSSVTARTNNQSTQYVTPASYPQNISPSSGYSGLSGVYVYGDSNLISENIKSGISIFGVNGSLSSGGTGQKGYYGAYFNSNSSTSLTIPVSGITSNENILFVVLLAQEKPYDGELIVAGYSSVVSGSNKFFMAKRDEAISFGIEFSYQLSDGILTVNYSGYYTFGGEMTYLYAIVTN
jgi:hypothetical protein